MSTRKLAFIVYAIAAILCSAWQYHRLNDRATEAARLRASNNRLKFEISGQRELAAERNAPAPDISSPPPAAPAPSPGESIRPGTLPEAQAATANYLRKGRATARNALHTLAWACDAGDAALLEELIMFDPGARAKATAFFASLPPHIRDQWGSLEAMAAAVIATDGMHYPFPIATTIDQAATETIRDGRIALLLPNTRRARMEFQETESGWKYVITETMVDDYIREMTQPGG